MYTNNAALQNIPWQSTDILQAGNFISLGFNFKIPVFAEMQYSFVGANLREMKEYTFRKKGWSVYGFFILRSIRSNVYVLQRQGPSLQVVFLLQRHPYWQGREEGSPLFSHSVSVKIYSFLKGVTASILVALNFLRLRF